MTLALTIGFFKDVQDLGKTIENKVIDMLRKFQRDPNSNGLNVEQLNNAPKNVRSVRIDRAFRAIGVLNGDVLTLVSCGDHEGTYRWMVGKDYNKLAENAMKLTDDPAFLMAGLNEESSTPFHALDNYTKEQLCLLGFTSGQAENLKNIKTQELFNEIKKMIIGEQAQILEFCEAGENFEDILELVESCREEKEIPVHSPVPNGVYVIEDDNSVDEFRKAVKGEIGTWRLFLHPSQERYAFGDFKGSVYICGEAGTGKTVAAVHRAKHLADTLADNEHILITTFTKNLATDIASMLDDMNTVKYLNVNGIKNRIVDDKTTGGSGINIATISRVKGLEFDNVIIWGLDKWMLEGVSPTFSNDPASSKETENSFRNGAYVAATRARKGLICFVKNN